MTSPRAIIFLVRMLCLKIACRHASSSIFDHHHGRWRRGRQHQWKAHQVAKLILLRGISYHCLNKHYSIIIFKKNQWMREVTGCWSGYGWFILCHTCPTRYRAAIQSQIWMYWNRFASRLGDTFFLALMEQEKARLMKLTDAELHAEATRVLQKPVSMYMLSRSRATYVMLVAKELGLLAFISSSNLIDH